MSCAQEVARLIDLPPRTEQRNLTRCEELGMRVLKPLPEGWRKRWIKSYAVFPLLVGFDPGGKLSIARVLASSCQNSPHAVNRSLI